MKQKSIGNDIYVKVDMAAVTAKRGDVKLIRFWLYEGLQLQGLAQIPPNSKDGDIIKVEWDEIYKDFPSLFSSLKKINSAYNLPKTKPIGNLFVVVHIKKPRC